MIITKQSLARRSFLRGVGVTVALPFLDAMVPAMKGATALKATPRMGFFYVPNGAVPPELPSGQAMAGLASISRRF